MTGQSQIARPSLELPGAAAWAPDGPSITSAANGGRNQGMLTSRSGRKPACVYPASTGIRAAVWHPIWQPPCQSGLRFFIWIQGDRHGTHERHDQAPRQ
jgi:hypothetical protein